MISTRDMTPRDTINSPQVAPNKDEQLTPWAECSTFLGGLSLLVGVTQSTGKQRCRQQRSVDSVRLMLTYSSHQIELFTLAAYWASSI